MKQFWFFHLAFVALAGAWAQPVVKQEKAASQTEPAQRRAELRSALNARRAGASGGAHQALEKTPVNRHLSAQERAELRQQLRQQRRDAKPDLP